MKRAVTTGWVGTLSAAAMVAMSAGGWAAIETRETASDACYRKAVATVEIIDCQVAEFEGLEHKLNIAYKAALASLPPDQRAKLVAAERLWVAFRTADCAVFYGKETGTAASIQAHGCFVTHDRARIDALDKIRP